ncbi:sensor histidine kinase [Staphylococcus kloosii]|jgi:two-component system sensor histidine kinase GraS|uniref:sensor histidine kinase n=1 Tax=Staphylococcus kloosii TaxID=29384 RepID=UPI00189FBED6|nr:sensor histidine kinase [Staphylococcus kloosii]MBF7023524.1 sensor histidine kinase [Staphylococcus kloosii]
MGNVKLLWMYLISRLRWILWIIFLNIIILVIAAIDYNIDIGSVLYIVILNIGLTLVYLIFSFIKETQFIRHIINNEEIEEIKHKNLADTPFQREVVTFLYNNIANQKAILNQQRQQIKTYEQSLTTFVHDIKTPVTSMKLLIDKEQDSERKKSLMYEWSRINAMLDMQLYLTRMQSQNKDLYFEHVALRKLVIEEIQLTRFISQARGIGFDLLIDAEMQIYTDTKLCRMMIRQALSNAIKYSENSTIVVEATLVNNHVTLSIKDEGRGISAKDLPRIFERGFTSTTFHNDSASSGIGLYLVNELKKALKVTVNINSELNKGTEVIFTFPEQNDIVKRLSQHAED